MSNRRPSKAKGQKPPAAPTNHPAGEDPEAQHRWDVSMGLKKEDDSTNETALEKRSFLAETRLKKANGGFLDWVYRAGNLVEELIDCLEEESFGLQELLGAARSAAMTLNDEQWQRFQDVPRRCVHAIDKDVITTLFSAAEPQWRTLLTTPKKGGTCVFLHIGTEPPSTPIVDLLTKLGWYGVSVSPEPPGEGNEDRLQHVELDPGLEEDEKAIIALQKAKGSMLPKPSEFLLAFADVIWDAENIDGDGAEASLFRKIDNNSDANISRKEFKCAQKNGMIPMEVKFKTLDMNGDGTISKDEFVQAIKAGFFGEDEKKAQEGRTAAPEVPMNQSGYGLLGVTWSPQVRWRLRQLRNVISVALQRLSNQGSLVITWHGIPNHPALLFITSQLRPVFLRVHVLVPEGSRSWETWILAASFKKQEAEEVASKGGDGFMFKAFIDNAYRCADLDDCLLWTLPTAGMQEEYRLGGGDRTIAKGYNELWSAYATKFRDLARELGAALPIGGEAKAKKKPRPTPGGEDVGGQGKDKGKGQGQGKGQGKAKGNAKAKAKDGKDAKKNGTKDSKEGKSKSASPSRGGSKEDAGSDSKDEGRDGSKDSSKDSSKAPGTGAGRGAGGESKEATSKQGDHAAPSANGKLPPISAKGKGKASTLIGSPGTMPARLNAEEKKNKMLRKHFDPSRSMPDLSSSFGGAPGAAKTLRDITKMGETFPIIRRAVEHLEKNSVIVGHMDRHDIEWAMRMIETKKFKESEEGIRAGGEKACICMPTDEDLAKSRQDAMKAKREARMARTF